MSALITPEMSRDFYEAKGRAAGEDPSALPGYVEDEDGCPLCGWMADCFRCDPTDDQAPPW